VLIVIEVLLMDLLIIEKMEQIGMEFWLRLRIHLEMIKVEEEY
jgi:hypothetical protein